MGRREPSRTAIAALITSEPCHAWRIIAWPISIAWAMALMIGFALLMRYETTPGPVGQAPVSWPTDSALGRVEDAPNVVVAVHPRCPCTRASLAALTGLLERSASRASVRLLVFRPAASGVDWAGSPPPAVVPRPGVSVVDDPGGVEAARFGLATSGATIAFDAGGRKRFVGGLTAMRGRPELSGGGRALLAVLGVGGPGVGSAEVYGCPLGTNSGAKASGGRR